LSTHQIARSLVVLRTATRHIDLDKVVEETHGWIKPFRLLLSPKERRENKDEPSGVVRLTTLVAGSVAFREAVLKMDVDRTLCLLMKSKLHEIFNEDQARQLLVNARREIKMAKETLHNDNNGKFLTLTIAQYVCPSSMSVSTDWTQAPPVDEHRYLTVIVEGEVLVIRTLDEDEISRGKCTIRGNFFGAWKGLKQPNGLPEAERETPIKEGGTGVNNCVIKAETKCEVILIPIANFREVISAMGEEKTIFFFDKMLEMLAFDVTNLEKLNSLVLQRFKDSESFFHMSDSEQREWLLPVSKRKYYKSVPELEREDIQDRFAEIQNLWIHLSRGAKTVPRGTVDMVKPFLGESGLQAYNTIFAPMNEHTASEYFTEVC
jgi:hypothetical protein